MDSLTQIALGSAVTLATMGRRTAAWKAVFWGAVAGTLPDLDAFIDHGDAMLNMVLHRSSSHALLTLTLLSGPLAWLVARLHGETPHLLRWWLALWLALVTHPLLDAMTVYGTQLLYPFTNYPYGVGSVFIIDPLYTVPLVIGVVAALVARGRDGRRGLRWNAWALVFSTAYLGVGVLAQQHVEGIARASLQSQGIAAERVLVTPAPFSAVLWRVVAMTPTHYLEGFRSLADGGNQPMRWTRHERGADLFATYQGNAHVQRLSRFTHGFYRMNEAGGHVYITDLRMGMEPAYSFHFDIGTPQQVLAGTAKARQDWLRPDLETALPWLWRRMWALDDGPMRPPPGTEPRTPVPTATPAG